MAKTFAMMWRERRKLTVLQCDQLKPSCRRCIRSGWTCPGYPPANEHIFRDQTAAVSKKLQMARTNGKAPRNLEDESCRIRHVSPSLADRATAFFLSQYVVVVDTSGGGVPSRGNHEYLPDFLRHEKAAGVLVTIVQAAGLAALANAGASPVWRTEAYRLYGKALCQLQSALRDPVEVKSDHTLAAVMLMGMFEASRALFPGPIMRLADRLSSPLRMPTQNR